MADKSIRELPAVSAVYNEDSFVLEQNGTAMRLTGQILLSCLAVELDAHGGIRRIDGPTTSGLTDTYEIVFSDETTKTFTVTNGRGISSITGPTTTGVINDAYIIHYNDNTTSSYTVKNAKSITSTSKGTTSGLTTTYNVNYNVGNSDSFTVTDGRGISSITGPTTSGLNDTYTINFNDGSTPKTFVVKNAKSITSVSKKSTSGLVDTYNVNYNNGSPDTFDVTNGAKGDKGDKGNKGDNITVSSIAYAYADGGTNGTNPTSIPSSSWSSTAPIVSGGHYLWARTTVTYSDSSTAVTYVPSYQGENGTGVGTVKKVNNISDVNGNVTVYGTNINMSSSDSTTVKAAVEKRGVVQITTGNFSSLPYTYPTSGTNSKIESDMVVINSTLSNPNSQASDWTVSTSDGSLTITGTFQGTTATNITLYLEKTW